MWSTETRYLSISGSVAATRSGMAPLPLGGVAVDVFCFSEDVLGAYHFTQLNSLPVLTNVAGEFQSTALPVTVKVQTVTPGTPPYTPVELIQPASLPNLAFRVSVIAGTQFVDVYDERLILDSVWETAHPERIHVPLTGSAPFGIMVPDFTSATGVPGKRFYFLRVGRAIRDEIGEIGESRPAYIDYQSKAGYLRSSDTRSVNVQPSFFSGQIDAPFGGTLQIGGQFGATFLTPPLSNNLYYGVSFWRYSGNPAAPLLPGSRVDIQDPLFNKVYHLPTPAKPEGWWESLTLGPFTGKITAVDPGVDPSAIGEKVPVYKRPGLPDLATEYWPFWDLMVIWNSTAAPADLVILTSEVYERTGGGDSNPQLKKLALEAAVPGSPALHMLPLRIDNHAPVPKYLPYSALDPNQRKFHTAYAHFIGAPESVGPTTPMVECNEMSVHPGDVDGNECILVKYSIEDGTGNPHQHLSNYYLWAEYTPKAVPGAPDALTLGLKNSFSGYQDISKSYSPVVPPLMVVNNFQSVIVPANADAWPPEPNGDTVSPTPCPQYALEVGLACAVRTVDGWSRIFGWSSVSRHIIIKRT